MDPNPIEPQTQIAKNKKEMEKRSTVDLYALPEACISEILFLTSPRDACRSSVVSSVFRSAADSDLVWKRFLPSDIQHILSSSLESPPLPTFLSKKELFLYLCNNPILIDNGTKTFALEKCSGKKCYMIGAKGLFIVWGNTPKYWKWRSLPESRFLEVAELLAVCWLEIRGKMETRLLSPNTTYGAYLVFKFKDRYSTHGFNAAPGEVSVKLASACHGEEVEVNFVNLNPLRGRRGIFRGTTIPVTKVPKKRRDGWMEIEMGEFFNERGEDGEVEMSLMEVKGGSWKSGLIIQGIELRPKRNQ